MIFFNNLVNIMRESEGKVIVDLVGCQYTRDDLAYSAPLVFFVLKMTHL